MSTMPSPAPGLHFGSKSHYSSASSGAIIWPRHEVLQLINPGLSHSGRTLSNSLAVEAARHLAKLQSLDGSIRLFIYLLSLLISLVSNNGIVLVMIS